MARVNEEGYLERRFGGMESKKKPGSNTYRDWWLVKHRTKLRSGGQISIHSISVPDEYIGKRIRIKLEVIEDEKTEVSD